jgi:phosphoribosylaminoimidazole-succinocarboxamide synthase
MKYTLSPGRIGSSKNILRVNGRDDLLAMEYSDRVSIFDRGPFETPFDGLGAIRCAISVKVLRHLQGCGYATNIVDQYSENTMLVKQVAIDELGEPDRWNGGWKLVPLEILWRRIMTEKFSGRLYASSELAQRFERRTGQHYSIVRIGMDILPTFVESSTKFEPQDRYLTDDEACGVSGFDVAGLSLLYDYATGASKAVAGLFGNHFSVQTGKFEIAYHAGANSFMICDGITPDELELGGFDKNILRSYYKETFPGWCAGLEEAKRLHPLDKSRWPAYPAEPPPELIERMVQQYDVVANTIGC